MTEGYVTFRVGEREFATGLGRVREVVRLTSLEALPGMTAPLAGVLTLRGAPLPVLDARPAAGPADGGDVLVIDDAGGEPLGVAVDAVTAVLGASELTATDTAVPAALPGYVVAVLSRGSEPVLMVDLHRFVELAATSAEPVRAPRRRAPRKTAAAVG